MVGSGWGLQALEYYDTYAKDNPEALDIMKTAGIDIQNPNVSLWEMIVSLVDARLRFKFSR